MAGGSKHWRQCTSLTRSTGERCRGPAMRGSDKCKVHLKGRTQRAAARLRADTEDMRKAMAKKVDAFNTPLAYTNPADALQQEINRTQGNVLALNTILAERGIENLMEQTVEETRTGKLDPGTTRRVEQVIGPWVSLYCAEREHLHRLTRTALQTSLEAWRLHIDQRQMEMLEAGMLAAFQALGLDTFDPDTRTAIAAGFRAMAAESRKQIGPPEALLNPPKSRR